MTTTKPDPRATFTALYADAYDDVLRFAQRRLHPDGSGAEDIVAETMVTAWRRVDDLPDDRGEARAWLFGIARNCLLNATRSRRRRRAPADDATLWGCVSRTSTTGPSFRTAPTSPPGA